MQNWSRNKKAAKVVVGITSFLTNAVEGKRYYYDRLVMIVPRPRPGRSFFIVVA